MRPRDMTCLSCLCPCLLRPAAQEHAIRVQHPQAVQQGRLRDRLTLHVRRHLEGPAASGHGCGHRVLQGFAGPAHHGDQPKRVHSRLPLQYAVGRHHHANRMAGACDVADPLHQPFRVVPYSHDDFGCGRGDVVRPAPFRGAGRWSLREWRGPGLSPRPSGSGELKATDDAAEQLRFGAGCGEGEANPGRSLGDPPGDLEQTQS